MKHFESFLATKLEEYIRYRKTLGYREKDLWTLLRCFDHYLINKDAKWDSLRPSFFLEFREKIKLEPRTLNNVLTSLNGFFKYLIRQDILDENPLQDIPPKTERAYIPFVFSPEETEDLLIAIQKRIRKSERHFLKDLAIYTTLLLMARCGLRISEPLRLLRNHYHPEERTLYIEKTKFQKDRLIPIPYSLVLEIENYLSVRKLFLSDDRSPYLLDGPKQRGLRRHGIYQAFHQGLNDIGLEQPRRVIGQVNFGAPTPHSLRHSFATNTLKRIKERGESPQYALPILATYMGHKKYKYTAVYLKVLDAQQRQGLVNFTRCHEG